MSDEKYFMWHDSGHPETFHFGPHYYGHEQAIGKKLYHSLSELLIGDYLPDGIKKRLKGAKVGTKIKIHYLHSNGDLFLICINRDQADNLDMVDKLLLESSYHRSQMYQKDKEIEKILNKILKK